MSPSTLLADLRQRGLELRADGEHLRYRAPGGVLTPELRRALVEHKPDLLAELAAEAARAEWERLDDELGEMNQRFFELLEEGERDAAKRLQDELRRLVGDEWHPARVRLARLEHRLGPLDPADAWLLDEGERSPEPHGTAQTAPQSPEPLVVDPIQRPDRRCSTCRSDAWREGPAGEGGGWVCGVCHPAAGKEGL